MTLPADDVVFDMPEPTKLMVAGDWHGSYRWVELVFERARAQGCDTILQLGDFGYWPAWEEHTQTQTGISPFLARVHELAERIGIPVYWLDGNHENHGALTPGQGDRWVRHLPRGHRWQWWGKTWMAVGGGVSVDKEARTPGYDWFPEETLTPEQFEHCLREGPVDIIVSHDCPAGVLIPGVHALQKQGKIETGELRTDCWFPLAQLYESEAHRGLLRDIVDRTGARLVLHGHYHVFHHSPLEPTLTVIGLDRDNTLFNRATLAMSKEVVNL